MDSEPIGVAHDASLTAQFAPALGKSGGPTFSITADKLPHTHAGVAGKSGQAIIGNISGGAGTGARRMPETAGGEHTHDIHPEIGAVTNPGTPAAIEYFQPYLPIHYLIRWKGPKM